MKYILLAAAALTAVFFLFFNGPNYKIITEKSGSTNTFVHKSHGYQLKIPKLYHEPEEEFPLIARNIEDRIFLQDRNDSTNYLVMGKVENRLAEIMIVLLKQLEGGAMSEEQFIGAQQGGGVAKIEMYGSKAVFSTTTKQNGNNVNFVMFRTDDKTLVGMVVGYSDAKAEEANKMVNSLFIKL